MTDTTFYPTPEQLKRLALTYGKDKDGKLVAAPNALIGLPPNAKHPIPAGGLFSTGADLAKLYRMMLQQGRTRRQAHPDREGVAEMTKVQTGDLKTGFVDGHGLRLRLGGGARAEGRDGDALAGHVTATAARSARRAGSTRTQDLFVILLIQRTGLPNGDASPMREDTAGAGGRRR